MVGSYCVKVKFFVCLFVLLTKITIVTEFFSNNAIIEKNGKKKNLNIWKKTSFFLTLFNCKLVAYCTSLIQHTAINIYFVAYLISCCAVTKVNNQAIKVEVTVVYNRCGTTVLYMKYEMKLYMQLYKKQVFLSCAIMTISASYLKKLSQQHVIHLERPLEKTLL